MFDLDRSVDPWGDVPNYSKRLIDSGPLPFFKQARGQGAIAGMWVEGDFH